MPTSRHSLLATGALVAAALAGCGSGSSRSSQTTTVASTAPAPRTTAPALAPGAAAPDSHFKLGQRARVAFEPLDGTRGPGTLDVTVEKIAKGRPADLAGVHVDGQPPHATPFFVTVKVTNRRPQAVTDRNDPEARLQLVDGHGKEQRPVILLGDFPRCEAKQPPPGFANGKSYTQCLLGIEPPGGAITAVRWEGADSYYSAPVTWK